MTCVKHNVKGECMYCEWETNKCAICDDQATNKFFGKYLCSDHYKTSTH